MAWLKGSEEIVLKRPMLRDEVKDFILEAILDGNLKPEDRVVETQVAKHLGISQAPVREAFRELEHIGVLHTERYKGSFVNKLTAEEHSERAVVRASLEETAIHLAMSNINERFVEQLEEQIFNMIDAAKSGNARKMTKYNVNFHRLIVERSENKFLLSTWENINPASWTTITTHTVKQDLIELAERHSEVLDAIKTHDSKYAGNVIREHIVGLKPDET